MTCIPFLIIINPKVTQSVISRLNGWTGFYEIWKGGDRTQLTFYSGIVRVKPSAEGST